MKAIRPVFGLAAGGAVAWGVAFAAFGLTGAAGDLFHGTVVQLVTWPVRSQRWEHLRPTLAADLAVWIAGAVEIAATLRRPRDRDSWKTGRRVYAIVGAFSLVALGWVKATYPQFYLLWFPVLATLAAYRLTVWCSAVPERLVQAGTLVVAVVLGTGEGWLWARAWKLGNSGPLPSLTALLHDVAPIGGLVAPPLILALLVAAIWLFSRREWWAAVMALCAIGMFHGVLRNVDAALTTNREQVRRLEVVETSVPPEGTILDGFSGYAVLRPNAYYFWWINEYSLALMTPAQREDDLLESLEKSPPAAVLFDQHLTLLPQSVIAWIRKRYAPAKEEPWLWLPRIGESRS